MLEDKMKKQYELITEDNSTYEEIVEYFIYLYNISSIKDQERIIDILTNQLQITKLN